MSTLLQALSPWEFSPTLVLLTGLVACLYVRGWRAQAAGARPVWWRIWMFVIGVGLVYAVMHTRIDYYARYLFWPHRVQHLVLHHLGPFLIMLAHPHPTLAAGLPPRWRSVLGRLWNSAVVQGVYRGLQQPLVAAVLFVGLICFWLTPAIHFDAMLSARRYLVMNWSMLVDGLLFWWLIFDPRTDGVRHLGFGPRLLLLVAVVPPQILIGAYISLSHHELFDVYSVCGRAANISPMTDQQIGGLTTWIPASMMSVVAALIVLSRRLRVDAADGRRAGALTVNP